MPFSFQKNAAPLQRHVKSEDNGRSGSQYNGQFSQMNPMVPRPGGINPGPMKPPDMGRGYGGVQYNSPIPRPIPRNGGPMPLPSPNDGQYSPYGMSHPGRIGGNPTFQEQGDGEGGQFQGQPWMKDPRMMQWLMSMFGGSGTQNSRGWF